MYTQAQEICCSRCKHATWMYSVMLMEEDCACKINKAPDLTRGCKHASY